MFMISDFNIFPIILLILLNFGLLSVYQLFYIYYKGKTLLSLICNFYCCSVKQLALKVVSQFDIGGLLLINWLVKKTVYSLIINVVVLMLYPHSSFNFAEKTHVNRWRVKACSIPNRVILLQL